MSYINNNRYNNRFYKNLEDAIESMSEDVELEEYENFLIDGKELSPEAQLIREKNRILLAFTHLEGQSFDFAKHNSFRVLLEDISNSISSQNYNYETLKKIMVHLDLELGIEVMFTASLYKMLEYGIENIRDYENFENFNYQNLYNEYNKEFNKRFK